MNNIPTLPITPEIVSSFAGILISLILSYVPGVNKWWVNLPSDWKRVGILVSLASVCGILFLLSCSGFLDIGLPCDRNGGFRLLTMFISALISNQTTYPLSPGVDKIKENLRS